MFDATISEMRGRANIAQQNGNRKVAKAYNMAADNLANEPRTIEAYRSFKKDFVDVSKVDQLTARAENGAATQMGRDLGGGIRRFVSAVAQRPVNAALAKIGGAVNSAADLVSADSVTPTTITPVLASTNSSVIDAEYNPATQVYNAIGRSEGLIQGEQERAANYLNEAANDINAASSANNTLEGLIAPTAGTTATSVYNNVYGTDAQLAGSTPYTFNSLEEERAVYFFPPTGDYWSDMLSRAMRRAKNAEDYDALGSLYEMYQDQIAKVEKANTSSSEVKLTDKQRQANAAERALNDFEQTEHNFAYDVSDIPVLGNIANFGGNEYGSKAEALALQIGYMLSGATVNKEEAKNIGMAYVPQPRDNEAVRQSKLAQIRGIISDYQKTYAD
jgi:hypothetical protein